MAQHLYFTLEKDFFVDLFKLSKEDAFAALMECLLNQFLQAESEEVLRVGNYERSEDRQDYRNGTRERTITTRIGKIVIAVPRHRNEPFHSTLLDNYQRCEQALITTMIEMVIQGVATRNIEKVTEELCGTKFSKSTISNLCKNLESVVHEFKDRPLEKAYPFVMVDAMYLKVREDYRVRSKALLVALGITEDGRKEIIGFDICETETELGWERFLRSLKNRGLHGVDMITSDSHAGLVAAIRKTFMDIGWQRCQFHFTRNILDATPNRYQKMLAPALREMFHANTLEDAIALRNKIMDEYSDCAEKAMAILDEGFFDSMTVMALPQKYRQSLRTSNLLERENEELRKREKAIKIFPNEESAMRLMGAVLLDHHDTWSTMHRVFSMKEYYVKRDLFISDLISA